MTTDHDDQALTPDKRLYSTGHVCQLLAITPAALESTMAQAGVPFVLEINSVPHLDGNGLEGIASFLRGLLKDDGDA